jgi:hypothetical protein
MVDTTIIHNEDTAWTGIWVGKRHLPKSANSVNMKGILHTTFSRRNHRKHVLLTGLSMILYVITPSSVMTGRIE